MAYTFTNLPTLTGAVSQDAFETNTGGEIVGYASIVTSGSSSIAGFIDVNKHLTIISDPLATYPGAILTEATGINAGGTIVGFYINNADHFASFTDIAGTFTTLTDPNAVDTSATGINNSGEIVGYIDNGDLSYSGFIDLKGTFTTVNDGSVLTELYAVNNSGTAVGFYDTGSILGGAVEHGLEDIGGVFTSINDTASTVGTVLTGINDRGQIVGYYYDNAVNGLTHGFEYYKGTYTTIDDGSFGTKLTGINQDGVVTGEHLSSAASAYEVAFTVDVPCYAAGTLILTPGGEIPIEDLAAGDEVLTHFAGRTRIIAAERRRVNLAAHPAPAAIRPIRIRAGALAPGIPARDLRLSPHHSVYLDGALFEAASLVNNVTIFQEQWGSSVVYHHLELPTHDILYAEGCRAESFLDTGTRLQFSALHPVFTATSGPNACAAVIRTGPRLTAMHARLTARAYLTNRRTSERESPYPSPIPRRQNLPHPRT